MLYNKLIFFFIPHHKIGGAERVHINIIKALYFKPIVFFNYSDSIEISKEFKDNAYCFLITNQRRRKYAFKFINFLSYVLPITVFGCNSGVFYDFVSRLKGKVKAIDLTHAFSFPEKGMEISSLPYVGLIDKRVVINQKTRNDYEILYAVKGIDKSLLDRFTIIPNGIRISKFENDIGTRFNNFTIGFVGRNSPEKRPELFFEIVKKLNIKAKVIGDNFDVYKKDFPNVKYFENCNDSRIIRNQFSKISLLIVSSSREGFPLVIMEAMELGIPVIGTNVGSISEHLINNKNGFLIPVEPLEFLEFSNSIINKLVSDKELYFSISKNARKYAEDNFNIIDFNIKYRELFYE